MRIGGKREVRGERGERGERMHTSVSTTGDDARDAIDAHSTLSHEVHLGQVLFHELLHKLLCCWPLHCLHILAFCFSPSCFCFFFFLTLIFLAFSPLIFCPYLQSTNFAH